MLDFVVMRPDGLCMKIEGGLILWVQPLMANKYPSKYAAKKHVNTLEMPYAAYTIVIRRLKR